MKLLASVLHLGLAIFVEIYLFANTFSSALLTHHLHHQTLLPLANLIPTLQPKKMLRVKARSVNRRRHEDVLALHLNPHPTILRRALIGFRDLKSRTEGRLTQSRKAQDLFTASIFVYIISYRAICIVCIERSRHVQLVKICRLPALR